jgi:hypothetical protein
VERIDNVRKAETNRRFRELLFRYLAVVEPSAGVKKAALGRGRLSIHQLQVLANIPGKWASEIFEWEKSRLCTGEAEKSFRQRELVRRDINSEKNDCSSITLKR